MKYLLSVVLLCHFIYLPSQYSISDIDKDGYIEDFDILVDIIKKQHPNPYRFVNEKIFNKKVDSLRNELKRNPNFLNFMLNDPTAIVKDGHLTRVGDSKYRENYFQTISFFPIQTYVNDGKLYVNGYNKYNIGIGSEILEINGKSISELIKIIPKNADGEINVENFDLTYYVSLILQNKLNNFKILYKNLNNTKEIVILNGIDFNKFVYNSNHSVLPLNTLGREFGIYGYKINTETFYLSVTSFAPDENYFYERLKMYFQSIRKYNCKNLIIDIRDNSGGNLSNIPLLYSFIAQRKTTKNFYKYGTKVINLNYKNYLVDSQTNQYYSEKDIADQDNFMKQRFDKTENGTYYFGNNRLDDSFVRNYPRDELFFDGKAILITNNSTFSAATYFASLFQEEKRGKIVGKETGTCSNFTTAAWFIDYKLPNTKTIVKMPRVEVFFNDDINTDNKSCRGVIPDFKLDHEYFFNALKEQNDPELEFALDLLSK